MELDSGGKLEQSPSSAGCSQTDIRPEKPVVCIVVGMAGSGKSTLMQRLNAYLHAANIPDYCINLDPAVRNCMFGVNIDIRDTIAYKEVMKKYQLGPNGAIMTCLNLFATRFDQVISFVEKRSSSIRYVLVDTPGQIEAFTWSASGTIFTDSFGNTFPTVLIFTVDVPRSVKNPSTFMANMLYACSMLYKTRLPLVVVFTKTDLIAGGTQTLIQWMQDFELFQDALRADSSYTNDLMNSMCLVLEEFYRLLPFCAVSSLTGAGMSQFFQSVDSAVAQYYREYLPDLHRRTRGSKEEDGKDVEMTSGTVDQSHTEDISSRSDLVLDDDALFESDEDEDT